MIRRNHIECSSKTDRNPIKYMSRPSMDQSHIPSRPQYRPQSQHGFEDIRLTSNNKKYHQYKDWKQNTVNIVKEFKDHLKVDVDPLLQLKKNEADPRQKSKLKRQYDYQLDDSLKIDYNSIKIDKVNAEKRESIRHKQFEKRENQRYDSTERSERLEIQPKVTNDVASHNISIDNTYALTPKIKDQSYKSIQKYRRVNQPSAPKMRNSIPKPFTPLFEQTQHEIERKYIPERHSTTKYSTLKADYCLGKTLRQNPHTNLYQQASLPYNHIPQKPTSYQFNNQGNITEQLNIKKVQARGKQQVQEKLKMISQFNDQINERIKNIIVCFQGLKNKL